MSPEQLQERGEYWASVMHLDDWQIRFTFAPPHELDGAWADADYDAYHKTALVRVLSPLYGHLQKWPTPEYDIDFSLVHELAHLLLEPLDVNEPREGIETTLLEQTVNKITSMVISLETQTNDDE